VADYVVRRDQDGVRVERDGKLLAGPVDTVHLTRGFGKPARIEIETGGFTSRTVELAPFCDTVKVIGWQTVGDPDG
jgi:hypothetical protein